MNIIKLSDRTLTENEMFMAECFYNYTRGEIPFTVIGDDAVVVPPNDKIINSCQALMDFSNSAIDGLLYAQPDFSTYMMDDHRVIVHMPCNVCTLVDFNKTELNLKDKQVLFSLSFDASDYCIENARKYETVAIIEPEGYDYSRGAL